MEQNGYTYTDSSFIECAKKGDIEAAKLFLAEGIDINAHNEKGQTALMRAAEYQRTEMVTLLLEKGAEINARDELNATPLHFTCMYGYVEAVRLLIELGAKPMHPVFRGRQDPHGPR